MADKKKDVQENVEEETTDAAATADAADAQDDDGGAPEITFAKLGLPEPVLRALHDVGYEVPTPIQARTIPPMLEGRDVLGQAQTGTGKTAAFALPILARIDLARREPQALVLAPTRELALQVSEAMQSYAAHVKGFHVLPIYGGTGFEPQLKALRRGVHVVVGTPGRVMDHMRRGTLSLDGLDTFVLDEADEMLRMGFVDDVSWVLEHAPEDRRVALFSATMPPEIARIAADHLRDPVEVRVEQATATADTVRQRFRVVPHHHKVDVLTRVLETEPYDGLLIFVRTRNGAVELSDKLQARGIASAALNGDVPQRRREQIVDSLKAGRIDVLVATDVAARGLDVERLTHVVNYDPPHDAEAYVHRIGRTGRAGRTGEAILFVTPRERHVVRSIERATKQKLERLLLPTTDEVNVRRVDGFKERVTATIDTPDAEPYRQIVDELVADGYEAAAIAAAIAAVGHEEEPLLLDAPPRWEREAIEWRDRQNRGNKKGNDRRGPHDGPRDRRDDRGPRRDGPRDDRPARRGDDAMDLYRVEVGYDDGVKPGNIVGAIAGESGLDGRNIGRIDIRTDHTMVELPTGMPEAVYRRLQRAWVCGKELRIERVAAGRDKGGPGGKGGKGGKRFDKDGGPPKKRGSKKTNPHKGRPKKNKKRKDG